MDDKKPAGEDSTKTPNSPTPTEIPKPRNIEPAEPATAKQLEDVEEKMSSFERATLRWARAAVIMSGLAALFVCLQWHEMHSGAKDTHDLAAAAGNQATWTQRLANSADTESGHMKELADRMRDQADRTKELADEAKAQAFAAKVSADAAKSASETAKEALHISERAYIIAGAPTLNATAGIATLPIINSGHIPSGKVSVVIHEATIEVASPNAPVQQVIPKESHWKHYDIDSLPPTMGTITYTVNIPLPAVVAGQMNKGFQQTFLVGTISYNDGFRRTSDERWNFCEAASLYAPTKDIQWRPCDWTLYMPEVTTSDHYPKDEYQ